MKRPLTLVALAIAAAFAAPNANAVLTCANDTQGLGAQWHVGERYPFNGVDSETGTRWCMASGQELVYIQNRFTGLRGRVGKQLDGSTEIWWQGEDAAFILDNL